MDIARAVRTAPVAQQVVTTSRRVRGEIAMRRMPARPGVEGVLLDGVAAALFGRASWDEQEWVDRIEAKRDELATLTEPVEFPPAPDGKPAPARTVGRMTASSKPPRWGYLLFRMVRATRPEGVLELGACVGISAAYQAAALELNGDGGHLTTLEGSPTLARRSARTQEELGLAHRVRVVEGWFTDTLPGVLDELGIVDFAFVDGHHEEQPTLDYTERILDHARAGSVLVYDDVAHFPGVQRAWQAFQRDPRFGLMIDLRNVGVAFVGGEKDVLHVAYG